MENASKALVIAGGVLIGIIILGLLIYMVNNLSSISTAQEKAKEAEQIAEFNKVYESYDKKKLRGSEVVSVINRAIDNNKKNNNSRIDVYVKIIKDLVNEGGDGLRAKSSYYVFTNRDSGTYNGIIQDTTQNGKRHAFMINRTFECTSITYNPQNGKANGIYFEEYVK